jgi:hypothetical protein
MVLTAAGSINAGYGFTKGVLQASTEVCTPSAIQSSIYGLDIVTPYKRIGQFQKRTYEASYEGNRRRKLDYIFLSKDIQKGLVL